MQLFNYLMLLFDKKYRKQSGIKLREHAAPGLTMFWCTTESPGEFCCLECAADCTREHTQAAFWKSLAIPACLPARAPERRQEEDPLTALPQCAVHGAVRWLPWRTLNEWQDNLLNARYYSTPPRYAWQARLHSMPSTSKKGRLTNKAAKHPLCMHLSGRGNTNRDPIHYLSSPLKWARQSAITP